MTMPEQAIRFGISDGREYRAATWKLWTPFGKTDTYLICRLFGGALKASLHQSGSWHVAYSQTFFNDSVKGALPGKRDRFLEKWPRPKPIAPGVTLAFRIVTPCSAVTASITDEDKNIIWLPNCPKQQATEIGILISSSTTSVTGWPGKNKMGTKLAGSYRLANGDSVWIVHRVVDMPGLPSAQAAAGGFYTGRSKKDLDSDNRRAILFGKELDGSRVIYDCAVGRKGS